MVSHSEWEVASCGSCAATIIWALTSNFRRIPLDAAPQENGNLAVVGEQGGVPVVVVVRSDGTDTPLWGPDEARYLSHFVSCPQADTWRKKR